MGVDVYKHPFSGSWQIIEGKYRTLILKTESSDTDKSNGVENLLGQPVKIKRSNVGSKKIYSNIYREFINKIIFPDEYLNKIYTNRYCRHFYSHDEIDKFVERWRFPGKR
jgi:hypothetical protein